MLIRRLLPSLAGLVVVALLTALRISDPYPLQVLREIGFDFYQRLHPRAEADYPVRVVDIDEPSLTAIGQWPWPRSTLATLTDRLTELGAAAIAFDVLFPEPDRMSPSRLAAQLPGVDASKLPDNDALFANSLANSPSILGFALSPTAKPLTGSPKTTFAVSGDDPSASIPYLAGAAAPLPALRDAAPGLAALSLNSALTTGTVRQLPLVWTSGTAIYPTLSIEALRLATGVPTMVIFGDTTTSGYVDSVRVGDFTVPTTSAGDLWLYYGHERPDLTVSAKDILGPGYHDLASRIAGQIVLIGTSASGLLDIHTSTLGENIPGVEVHAQALEQILSSTYLTRPDWVEAIEWLSFVVLGVAMVLVVLRLGPFAGLIAGALSLGLSLSFSWWAFITQGWMIDPSFPLVGLTLVYMTLVFVRFLTTDAAKRQIRRAFGYYVAPALLTEIEKSGEDLKLGGANRTITVMFTDMRNFTSFSEKLEPQQILKTLNTMFGALGAEIVTRMGTIDKFIGDAIMAYWNAPVDVPGHERKAVEAALAMRLRLAELNDNGGFGAGPAAARIGIGIGISTGDVVVGNMGLETRFDYSAIGDTVNVASRVEGASKEVGYDIVIAEPTCLAVPEFAVLEAGAVHLKGKALPVKVFIAVGDDKLAETGSFKLLRATHADALKALRTGADARGAIAECLALCVQVEPGLKRFYEKLGERQGDFAPADQKEAAE